MVRRLSEAFPRCRVVHDPAASGREAWSEILPCAVADAAIFAHSDALLAVEVTGSRTRQKLAEMGLQVRQWGDSGYACFLFPWTAFDDVARVVRPRQKRILSEERRKIEAERLRAFRFRPRSSE